MLLPMLLPDNNSKAYIIRLNGHRLWAIVKEAAFGSGWSSSDLSQNRKKGASAGFRTALAPFMTIIFILFRLRPVANQPATSGTVSFT